MMKKKMTGNNNMMDRLAHLRERGVIEDIDLEFCRFLQNQEPGISDEVLKAACLASYQYRRGNICLLLDEYAGRILFEGVQRETERPLEAPRLSYWKEKLSESNFVGQPGAFRPLILDSRNRLYLHKLWHYEKRLAEAFLERCRDSEKAVNLKVLADGLERLFPSTPGEEEEEGSDWQRVAAALAVKHQLSVISGGPGTGKTSTVSRILVLLAEQGLARGQWPSIALTAPTGKAAGRLQDAILSARENLPVSDLVREALPARAGTLHQLLGARRHTSQFKHDKDNPLPRDVVVVDEVSMVDQTLMSRLMEALPENTRLILLGDRNQLASVEAGSVLGDICMLPENQFSTETAGWLELLSLKLPADAMVSGPRLLADYVTLLTKSYRFKKDSGISRLAESVNRGEADESAALLLSPRHPEISFTDTQDASALKKLIAQKTARYYQQLSRCTSPRDAFEVLQEFRILAAHRKGPRGIEYLNQLVEQILQAGGYIPKYRQWYAGKPVIININDYSLGLHNGDTGICLPGREGNPKVYFRHEDSFREIAPARLPDHNRAYALTVHKSQGSEFHNILLVLPSTPSKVVSRELIYTAVTRAREAVGISAPREVLAEGIKKELHRTSGLADRLWG